MRKSTLSNNTLLKNKFRWFVTGLPESNSILSIGSFENEIGVIERPDKTKITAGRTGGGSMDIQLEFADTLTVDAYYGWYESAIDRGTSIDSTSGAGTLLAGDQIGGSIIGVSSDYKRSATLIYHRQYDGGNNRNEQFRTFTFHGCWLSKFSIDESNIDTEEHQVATLTLNYDDVRLNLPS